ncbi:MAG: RIP metalloprotease RseP, partial [Elusimicrobia bacterium]|nr:RIP metalloprotease RseP [Elusimicrobiota bacterium]
GVFRSLKQSFKFTFELCRSFIVFIGRMIVGTAPPEVSGPIGIAGAVSEAASAGLASLFQLIALISVQLGLINLFPIPILDGGHIILSILEKLKGSRLDDKKVMAANVVGLMLLFSLVLFASWQDIQRLFQ